MFHFKSIHLAQETIKFRIHLILMKFSKTFPMYLYKECLFVVVCCGYFAVIQSIYIGEVMLQPCNVMNQHIFVGNQSATLSPSE